MHKQLNYKPSLLAVRDQEEMLKIPKTKLCNEIWKPISMYQRPGEKREEDATNKFYNNQGNGKDEYKSNDNEEDKRALEKEEMANYEWNKGPDVLKEKNYNGY